MNALKHRGVSDVLIAVVDGLNGFPEAITAVFPQTIVQTCIIPLIRHSMDFAAWKDRKILAGVLKTIYRAKDADAARAALEAFDASQRGQKYPAIAQSWRRNWERVIPFFAFPEAVRPILYTTDAIDEAVSLPTGSLSRARATSWRSAARRLQAPPGVLFVPCRIEALARFCFRRTRSPAIDEARGVAFRLLGQLLAPDRAAP